VFEKEVTGKVVPAKITLGALPFGLKKFPEIVSWFVEGIGAPYRIVALVIIGI
jgi:hypothetical protein